MDYVFGKQAVYSAGEGQEKPDLQKEDQKIDDCKKQLNVSEQDTVRGEEYCHVRADMRYLPGTFGFITEQEIRSQRLLSISEAGMGFRAPQFLPDSFSVIEENEHGCFINSGPIMERLDKEDRGNAYKGRICPLWFRADLPDEYERTALITLTFTSLEDDTDIMIFAGRRHFVWHGEVKAGEEKTATFVIECLPIIPNGQKERVNRRYLDVALTGKSPVLKDLSVLPADLPVLFTAGDSTMQDNGTDFPYHSSAGYAGWGQALDLFFSPEIAVCNQSHNGRTTESFRSEGHFNLILEYLRPGDYVLFQFGHNDQKHAGLQAENGYPINLGRYIDEVRKCGGRPLLATPVCRNTWKDVDDRSIFTDLLAGHAEAVRRLGSEKDVPVLDMNLLSAEAIKARGQEASAAFYHEGDLTHTNDFGGYRTASFAAEEMIRYRKENRYPEYQELFETVQLQSDWEPVVMKLLQDPSNQSTAQSSEPAEHQAEAMGQVERLLGWINDARKEAGLSLL